MTLYQNVSRKIPGLKSKLNQARVHLEPEEYIRNIFKTSVFLSMGIFFMFFFFYPSIFMVLVIPISFPFVFMYFLNFVDMKIEKIKRQIDQEIIFAGKFIIIGLESGVPIYKVFEDLEKNYEYVGFYFGEILNKVYLGTTIEDAINEILIESPSPNLRRILWQILNSIKTGTEVGPALNSVIDQIVREQEIAIEEYGKKLNPMAMFYMMISIIIPSLGITMLVIMATFLGLNVTMPFFIVLAVLIGLVQFMFLSMIKYSRPSIST